MSKKSNNESTNIIDDSSLEELAFSVPIVKEKKPSKVSNLFKSFVDTIKGSNLNVETINLKSKLVKFSAVLSTRKFRFKILIIILVSMIIGLLTLLLIKNSGLYSLGINGIFQGIAKFTKTSLYFDGLDNNTIQLIYNILFWGSNIIFNIPLAIFAYKKVSKQFAYLTIIYIIFSQMFGLAFDYIPGLNEIHIFGNTKWNNSFIEPLLVDISFSRWGESNTLSLLIYCVFNGILSGFFTCFILMIGGSTGGTDVFSMYFAKRKSRPVGLLMLIFNNICLFISTMIGTFASLALSDIKIITEYVDPESRASSVIQSILSPNYVFSAIMAVISGLVIDFIFPKSKFIQLKIYTEDANKLKQNLLLVGYSHDMYINEITNAVTDNKIYTIETICMYIELPTILHTIRLVDSNSLITINKLADIDGKMNILK